MKKNIYLDHAAATPIDRRVIQAMRRAEKLFGNPSSFNDAGRQAREAIGKARSEIAFFLGVRPEEIIFTSSGSEANNLALLGMAQTFKEKGSIVISAIEHPSVAETALTLEKWGWKIYRLDVDQRGFINVAELEKILAKDRNVKLVSIMYANNEIGTIESIAKLGRKLKTDQTKALFHVDACQATGYLDMNIHHLGADLLTFNSSKVYGPRGIAVLYIRRGVNLSPLIKGGDQEHGLRAGTENTAAIVGLAKAVSLINKKEKDRLSVLRDYFISFLLKKIPEIKLNGPIGKKRLPNNINISVPGLESEVLLLELDKYGIYAGSGSACTSWSVEPSHVLKAVGVKKPYLDGALRFSLGRSTTKKDLDYVIKTLPKIIADLRKRY